MKKKVCICISAAFTVLLSVSAYFVIGDYVYEKEQTEKHKELITLSTCEYSRNNCRLVVLANLIGESGDSDGTGTDT